MDFIIKCSESAGIPISVMTHIVIDVIFCVYINIYMRETTFTFLFAAVITRIMGSSLNSTFEVGRV